ncbi:MAG: lipoate--protein ligase family protein [Solirubrobacteraceae bacterium]
MLRVIDAGSVSAVRSQALWHGLAEAMRADGEPVLSFCRPAEPYVCIGYHRRLDEIDQAACQELGLPVLRRQIGGGPVYLDSDQLFFQITVPAGQAPALVSRLYAELLAPAATALRSLGVDAEVSSTNDLVAGARKVSGTGAGQIGGGVVVVGNVMFGFPHERMARALRLPDERMRAECLRLMRAHVAALPQLGEASVKSALQRAYALALGLSPRADVPRPGEQRAIERWAQRLCDPAWLAGPDLPERAGRQVKVRAGVWVYDGAHEDLRVRATVEAGRVSLADIDGPSVNGSAAGIARALLGTEATAEALGTRLAEFGDVGARVLAALQPGLVVR